MKVLLLAGLLYLSGVAVILFIRPQLMFTEKGVWKEFGIGRDSENYTWFPVWLFCIVWAFISYYLVALLVNESTSTISIPHVSVEPEKTKVKVDIVNPGKGSKGKRTKYVEKVKPGYYILNTEGSSVEGVPKYIYLGAKAP